MRRLLISLGGKATIKEISQLAQDRYPNRTLHSYIGERLKGMEKKDFVTKNPGDVSEWELTDKGTNTKIGDYNISDINELVTEERLIQNNIQISNIVGSIKINSELNLEMLSVEISNTEYNPETSPNLVYRTIDKSVTVLAHSTGSITILGAKNRRELIEGLKQFLDELDDVETDDEALDQQISINNIVATSDMGRELDLSVLAVNLKLENIEYNPEKYSALVYRTKVNPTVMIFKSGKCVITGAKTYAQVLGSYQEIKDKLVNIGVEL